MFVKTVVCIVCYPFNVCICIAFCYGNSVCHVNLGPDNSITLVIEDTHKS